MKGMIVVDQLNMKPNQKTPTTPSGRSARSRCNAPTLFALLTLLTLPLTGCQVLTYSSPNGERFTRSSLASTTAIQSLSVDSTTNGIRRVELRGYQNDSSQALGVVTEAAIRAALQSATPLP